MWSWAIQDVVETEDLTISRYRFRQRTPIAT
jgi:hypothetical protein